MVGLPGETLELRNGDVYINGEKLHEPFIQSKTYPNLGPIQLSEKGYFVMGDNRLESSDSRHFGEVLRENIKGRINH